ncbi:ribose transport system permease protein [Microbacterium ginsengiterrae]|uniref:Ribose transport system permease protein n=1 Tax=Microbacterium ginsengiterrae TaxID=546115 RepID=A0A7W9FAB4_9MICO|nr:ABC transporter permease [Microbacterium ginsengiterrae]MBB5741957.1 ribose transport system permease protein [Microbacterium ginsengiterrae]
MTTSETERVDLSATRPVSQSLARRLFARQEVLLLIVFAAMVIIFSSINPRYFSTAAASNILQDFAPVLLMAIGQTLVIITGGIDLSVGSILGLSGVVTAMTARAGNEAGLPSATTILLAILSGIVVGVVVGAVNGLLVTRLKLAPFIATLATMGAVYGVTLVITSGVQIAGGPKEVILIGNTTYLGLFTLPILIVFTITAVVWVFLAQSRFGRYTYAIGSNPFAARAAGINVKRHLMKVYMLSGVVASLAGILVYFRLGSGAPSSGQGGELQAIAAAVIGGVSLVGGIGRLGGTILGALIITSVLSGLILIGVAPAWQQVVIGALIAIAVAVQGLGGSTRKAVL